jgi:signal transduction histidine kinase
MIAGTETTRRRTRILVLAGLAVAIALVFLAATADHALRERHALTLAGRVITLAHETEAELRRVGPQGASAALAAALDRWHGDGVDGLALVDDTGVNARVGNDLPDGEAGPLSRTIHVYLGRGWKDVEPQGGIAGHAGQRLLRVTLSATALEPPVAERLLLPATTFAGLALVALAMFGGRQLVRSELAQRGAVERRRIEGLARAGAGLAHQLRTPLATIKGSAQLLLERSGCTGEERRLRSILEQIERMEGLLTHLLDYARPPAPEPSEVNLSSLLGDVTSLAPQIEIAMPRDLVAWADPDHLLAILGNLIDNARRVSPAATPIRIAGGESSGRVVVTVSDRGPGPGDNPEALFEPYSTGRADGTGLGLPIARALAEANGGTLELRTGDDGGAQAVLELKAKGPTP